MSAPATVSSEAPSVDARRRPCHLIGEDGRALCGASVAGRRIHDRLECIERGHYRCVVCEELDGGVVLTTDGDFLR